MDIKGETIQNGEPTPEHPVEIENKINLTGAIQILNKLKSKVTLVKVDDENNSEKEYRLPYLISIEKQAIETVLSELEKKEAIINEMADYMEQDIEEMKKLFYADRLTAYGKRKLIEYYEQRIKQLEEENQLLLNSKIGVDLSFDDYIPVSLVEEKIEEIQKEYEETLKTANFKEIEKMNKINFREITLEGQRSILRELLENRK